MRSDVIDQLLCERCHEIGLVISRVTPAEYAGLPPRPEKRLGLYGPLPYPEPDTERQPDDPPYKMVWSADYIDRLTDDLTDEQMHEYLEVVIYVSDLMVALGREIPEPVDRFRHIEDRIVENYPGSTALLNHVELRALDRELEPG